ncbi:DUF47 family protein [Acidaminobacter sp. JC074]|uniref:DUF47 domain-containing protein n=1 Tax=Acidaminobacter sp. JC074 TaxID=2530199 RepID=UPI001F0EFD7A|nr:DUF47 family protein [Acidaminobacter sp. JC074]MCH4889676.1 DUF47 family protein [Acidaminobacter sp. JC074]
MNSIFKKSIELNMKIEKFLDIISNSLLLFEKEMESYLENDMATFIETHDRICALESEADELETEIKVTLYKFMLLPDTRADVLSIIKSLDNIIDDIEEFTKDFHIQKPVFPQAIHQEIMKLTKMSIQSADALISAIHSFFNEVHLVNTHINKVRFYEHEADILEDKILYSIFNEGIVDDLAEKLQLKSFINMIADVSDEAEVISEKLTIFTIKREI